MVTSAKDIGMSRSIKSRVDFSLSLRGQARYCFSHADNRGLSLAVEFSCGSKIRYVIQNAGMAYLSV